jgi:ethanolamine utilization protein EutQ
MSKTALIALIVLGAAAASAGETEPRPMVSDKPVKVTAAQAAGPIFKSAVEENGADGPAKDALLLRSADRRVEMGLYSAGPSEQDITSYPDDEFMYFLAGGVTLTSADGTVLEVRTGEGIAMPRGWKGHWSTKGYKKYYVTYDPAAK